MAGRKQNEAHQLAEQIVKWQEEMMMPEVSAVGDIQKLCRGNIIQIFHFLLDHVKPEAEVKQIRANVKLSKMRAWRESSENVAMADSLRQEREKFKARVSATENSIESLEHDIKRLREEVLATQAKKRSLEASIYEAETRNTVQRAHAYKTHQSTNVYKEYAQRLQGVVKAVKKLQDMSDPKLGEFFEAPLEDQAIAPDGPAIESYADKSAREFQAELSRLLLAKWDELCEDTSIVPSAEVIRSVLAVNTKDSQTQAEFLSLPPALVVPTLVNLIKKRTSHLRAMTQRERQDLDQEAEGLGYSVAGGVVQDVAEVPSAERSVYYLLEAERNAHIARFMEQERLLNEADAHARARKELERTRQRSLATLAASKDLGLEGAFVDTLGVLQDRQATADAADAAASKLEDILVKLRGEKEERERANTVLREKHTIIRGFEEKRRRTQELLRDVVRHNSQAQHAFLTLQDSLLKRVAGVQPYSALSAEAAGEIKARVPMEMDRFAHADIALLRPSTARPVALSDQPSVPPLVRDLSINEPASKSMREALDHARNSIQFNANKSCEGITAEIVKCKRDNGAAYHDLDAFSNTYAAHVHGNHVVRNYATDRLAKELVAASKDTEASQQELRPKLLAATEDSEQSLGTCKEIEDLMQQWWEQPAQHVAPWVKLGGLSVTEVVGEWRTEAARRAQP